MSARQRARLRQLEEQEARRAAAAARGADDSDEEDDDDEASEDGAEDAAARTGFGFLNDSSSDDGSEDDEDDDDEEEEEGGDNGGDERDAARKPQPANKVDAKQPARAVAAADHHATKPGDSGKDDLAFLEQAIAAVELEKHASSAGSGGSALSALCKLLAISDVRHLNPDHELKRKLARIGAAEAAAGESRRRPNAARRGAQRRVVNKNMFCTLNDSETLPPPPSFASGGARMNLLGDTEDGGTQFSFEAADTYRQAHNIFGHIQATYDPNQIVAFLQQNPWHVPAHLAMVSVYSQTSQLETAEMMLRSALYILESWVHPRFPDLLAEGRCRLQLNVTGDDTANSDCGLNAVFYNTLFKSLMACRRKSLHDTAFALGKLLFSLDPSADPLHLMLVLDQLALNAGKNDWVVELAAELPQAGALPGVAFAKALALRRLGRELEAIEAAQTAIRAHPSAFVALVGAIDKAGTDVRDATVQSGLAKASALATAAPPSPSLDRVNSFFAKSGVGLYTSAVGSASPPFKWLAFQAANMDDDIANTPIQQGPDGAADHSESIDSLHARYAKVRFAQFVDDTGAANLVDGAEDDDPFGAAGAGRAAAPPQPPNVNLDNNLFNLFMQTMMPWARLPGGRDDNAQDGPGGGEDAGQ